MFTSRRGRPKVPFSWCRCHVLVIDYRWGSMGSNETATATTGGPRVIGVLAGASAIGSNLPTFFGGRSAPGGLGVGLVVGKRLHRIRHRCDSLVLPRREQTMAKNCYSAGLLREIDQKCLKRRRMRCRRLHVYSTDPRRPQGDGGAGIDRIPPARLASR